MTKNVNYRKFLDHGEIKLVTTDHIKLALNNINGIRGQHIKEGRALLIALYYTGARPNEILRLVSNDISRDQGYIVIKVPSSKKGKTRPIYIKKNRAFIKELYDYSNGLFPNMKMFYHYITKHQKSYINRKGEVRHYEEISAKLRHHVKKWFDGVFDINPYYLRHSRFSQLTERGVSASEIMILKGGRSMECVTPYLHLSSTTGKKIAKHNE